jgi:hypothetical protein
MPWPKKVIPVLSLLGGVHTQAILAGRWADGPHCVDAALDVDTRTPLAAVPEVFAGIHQQPHSHGGAGRRQSTPLTHCAIVA